jgi:hypothetical protein
VSDATERARLLEHARLCIEDVDNGYQPEDIVAKVFRLAVKQADYIEALELFVVQGIDRRMRLREAIRVCKQRRQT